MAPLPVLLLALALSPARAGEACLERFGGLCGRLSSDPRVMLGSAPAFLPNPARTGPEILDFPDLSRRVSAGDDAANLERRVRPMFRALVAIAQGWAASLPADSPGRRGLEKRLSFLTVESYDRRRCRERDRPFVAGTDGSAILLCPWMTHLDPAVMLTALAHELGHLLDPCWHREPGRPAPFPTVRPLPSSRDSDCSRDEEEFADQVGARLVDEVLLAGPPVPFPAAPDERFAAFLFYMLSPECRIAGNPRLPIFLSMPRIRAFLGCAGP